MIYKFRMISGDNKVFLRDYEIDSNQTFLEFHKLIQNNLNYDASQLTSFFLTDEKWNKGLELTLIDMDNDAGPAAIPMNSVRIKDTLKERKERLLYVYDIFNDSLFFLELMDINVPDCAVKYPICSASVGESPLQSDPLAGSKLPISYDDSIEEIFNEFDNEDFESGSEGFDGNDESIY